MSLLWSTAQPGIRPLLAAVTFIFCVTFDRNGLLHFS